MSFPGVCSGLVEIAGGGVATVVPPGSGGFLMVTIVDPAYSQAHHSGLLAFDACPSPGLISLTIGTVIANADVAAPGALTGEASRSNIAVDATGIHIKNRTGDSRVYSYTLIG